MKRKKHTKRKNRFVVIAIILIIIGILIFRENQRIIVCIDAGHGGNDVGSVSSNGKRYEKDDNLEVALKVKEQLEKNDIKVVLTRNNDTYLSLEKRCVIANIRRADLFVSIHRNSAKSGDGIEIWVDSQKNEDELELANSIMNELDKTEIQTNRGVKSGTSEDSNNDYFVNKNTRMPSCLIELGFISNWKDNQLFDENIDEYAEAIANGILKDLSSQN